HLAFSNGTTGSGIAWIDNTGHRIFVFDLASHVLRPVSLGNEDFEPTWSPDGKWIAYTSDHFSSPSETVTHRLWVVEANGNHPHQLLNLPKTNIGHPAWSPHGKHIAFYTQDVDTYKVTGIATVDVDGQNLVVLAAVDGVDPAWSPDGTTIAFALKTN